MLNDFNTDLKLSKDKEVIFNRIYNQYFTNIKEIKTIEYISSTDIRRQNIGIDREIYLNTGEKITTQEKYRRESKYTDFLIEFEHVYNNGEYKSKGWIYTISSDYIFYVFGGTNNVLIYPVHQLKHAWERYNNIWKEKYGIKKAYNSNYITLNVAIPCNELENALVECMHFKFI